VINLSDPELKSGPAAEPPTVSVGEVSVDFDLPEKLIAKALKLLEDGEPESSLETSHKALETYLKIVAIREGATPGTPSPKGAGKQIPFERWHVVNCLSYLDSIGKLPEAYKKPFFKINELRNPLRHGNAPVNRKLVERAIAVIDYAIKSEGITSTGGSKASAVEGGPFKLPTTRSKTVSRASLAAWEDRGWYEARSFGSRAEIRRGPYKPHELFEVRVRHLFNQLGFADTISDIENFWDTTLGPQVDAYGGTDGTFLVVDCTTKRELGQKSLAYKIKDILSKEKKIRQRIDSLFPGRYPTKRFAIFTHGIDIRDDDVRRARESGITIVDSEQVQAWFGYVSTLGEGLRHHIMRAFAGHPTSIVDTEKDPFYHFPAFKTSKEGLPIYYFLSEPSKLLKLGYVYRLELGEPEGYQRELIRKKLLNINDFLSVPRNYFANNVVLCFDSLVEDSPWPDFEPTGSSEDGRGAGILHVPKLYCSAEIIDGQHRVYGYLDASGDLANSQTLLARRKGDRISVVAITDPSANQRASLFVDINSNQTKVNPRRLWTLVARVRPETQMGYASLIVIGLNEGPVFRNLIHIPGRNGSKGKRLNIANFGKGILDRRLVDKDNPPSLFDGDRDAEDYANANPIGPTRVIEAMFRPLESPEAVYEFAFTNNGANVILRLLAELLRYCHVRTREVKTANVKDLSRLIRRYLMEIDTAGLLKRTSNEAERAAVSREIMKWVRTQREWTAFGES
jgi:DGQHR domain-containing protein